MYKRGHLVIMSILLIQTTNIYKLHGFHIDNLYATKNRLSTHSKNTSCTTPAYTEEATNFTFDIIVNPLALQQAAKDALRYIKHKKKLATVTLEPTSIKPIMDKNDVVKTLKFIIKIIEEDKETGNYRILDPNFINTQFRLITWGPFNTQNQASQIKLTNYVVYNVKGSWVKTAKYNCALYKLLDASLRTKFTKHQILYGALEKPGYQKKAIPLAWLTRDDFEQALLQGTVLVNFPNKSYKIFMVNSNNNIEYNKSIKDIKKQKRYWFFNETKNPHISLDDFKKRIQDRKEVIFAGDLENIGIGKLIAIQHINQLTQKPEVYLGVLADTGGAFINNPYQLDFFAGIFNNSNELKKYLKKFPLTTKAFVLCRK